MADLSPGSLYLDIFVSICSLVKRRVLAAQPLLWCHSPNLPVKDPKEMGKVSV